MPHGETYSGLYEFFEGNLYATVDIRRSGDGWVSEWWISRNLRENVGIELLGRFIIPVWGDDEEQAKHRCGFIYEDVMNLARDLSGGYGAVGSGGDVVNARRHCKAHLQVWNDLIHASKTEKTAEMYLFAMSFEVNNPAALIAEVEVLRSVRTVHDRLAHARRLGLLDSPGKGNKSTKKDTKEELDDRGTDAGADETGEDSGNYRIFRF